MRARKITAVFVNNCQKELNPTERVRWLKHFSETRQTGGHETECVDKPDCEGIVNIF